MWKGVLKKLERAESVDGNKERLWGKLRVSVDALDETARVMFLDLTVFDGYHIALLETAWESTFSIGEVRINLRNLFERSLIMLETRELEMGKASEWNPDVPFLVVKVHQQLRDLGRSILRPLDAGVKLWKGIWYPGDVDQFLKYEGKRFEAQLLSVSSTSQVMDWSHAGKLEKLRLLRLKNVILFGDCNLRLPAQVSFLHMLNCSKSYISWWKQLNRFMESRSWPIREQDVERLSKLSVLLLENCTSIQLPNNFHCLKSLRVLRIHAEDMTQLPESFGLLPALQILSLRCPKLQQLPASVLHLPELTVLELRECLTLKLWPSPNLHSSFTLPASGIMRSLTSMGLDGASNLTELPDSFGQIKSLQKLKINRCHALKQLPEGFGDLHQLQILNISNCDSLTHLCNSFGQMKSLVILELKNCSQFWCLPETLGDLEALRDLMIRSANIKNVPESIGQLKMLENLSLEDCSRLENLPESVGRLRLEVMTIARCEKLESFSAPKKVTRFELIQCDGIQSLSASFKKLQRCGFLTIERLKNLWRLGSVGQIRGLYELRIEDCHKLRTLPKSIEKLEILTKLVVTGCHNLRPLPAWEQLGPLKLLDVKGGSPPENFPALMENLPTLEDLRLCCNHKGLDYLKPWKCLRNLTITDRQTEYLPDSIENLETLQLLEVVECDSLKTLPTSIGRLKTLLVLQIIRCPQFEVFPESIGNLAALTILTIMRCDGLKRLPQSIGQLKRLYYLNLESCKSIHSLPISLRDVRCTISIRECSGLPTVRVTASAFKFRE